MIRHVSSIFATNSANSLLSSVPSLQATTIRTLLRPRPNRPYRGIYKRDGDVARKNDLLVCQIKMNYHPGANVGMKIDRGGQILLKALVDGKVMITQERINPDFTIPQNMVYKDKGEEIYKMTFNVLPFDMSQRFRLVTLV